MDFAGNYKKETEKAFLVERSIYDPADQIDSITFWIPKSISEKRESKIFVASWMLDKKRDEFSNVDFFV